MKAPVSWSVSAGQGSCVRVVEINWVGKRPAGCEGGARRRLRASIWGFSTGKTWALITGVTGVKGERPVKE